MSTLAVNPVAGSVSPCDGYIRRVGQDATISSIVTVASGAGGGFNSAASNSTPILKASTTTNQFAELIKTGVNFDTSALTSLVTVSAATLSLWVAAKSNGLGDDSYGLVSYSPASPASVAAVDWLSFGSSILSNALTYASITTGAYNDFTLNAGGIAAINKVGITSFGIFSKWAIDQVFTGTWASGASSSITYNTADSAHPPILTITYNVTPVGSAGSLSLLGVGK